MIVKMTIFTLTSLFSTCLGMVNVAAFLSWHRQYKGLIGEHGITSSATVIKLLQSSIQQPLRNQNSDNNHHKNSATKWQLGDYITAIQKCSSIFIWTGATNRILLTSILISYLLSTMLILQIAPAFSAIALAILYHSHIVIAQPYLCLQMDSTLIETNVIFGISYLFSNYAPNLWIYLQIWLVFRIMVGCGVAKYTGNDIVWRNLLHYPAMSWHYETQPL